MRLHAKVKDRLAEIEKVVITTQESAIRIISKTGPLYNPADRDHCLQYIVATALINGELTADSYTDAAAADPRIDALRDKMDVLEDTRYSREYHEPESAPSPMPCRFFSVTAHLLRRLRWNIQLATGGGAQKGYRFL